MNKYAVPRTWISSEHVVAAGWHATYTTAAETVTNSHFWERCPTLVYTMLMQIFQHITAHWSSWTRNAKKEHVPLSWICHSCRLEMLESVHEDYRYAFSDTRTTRHNG